MVPFHYRVLKFFLCIFLLTLPMPNWEIKVAAHKAFSHTESIFAYNTPQNLRAFSVITIEKYHKSSLFGKKPNICVLIQCQILKTFSRQESWHAGLVNDWYSQAMDEWSWMNKEANHVVISPLKWNSGHPGDCMLAIFHTLYFFGN